MKLAQAFTYYYFIKVEGIRCRRIHVVDWHEPWRAKRISPVFIMQEYRNRGLAQQAIRLAEEIHGSSNWELRFCRKREIAICMKNWVIIGLGDEGD